MSLVLLSMASSAQAFIYWTSLGGSIGRANNDGSGANQSFIGPQHVPAGIAVNATHIFWANSNDGGVSIGRANLNGTGVNPNFIPAVRPFGVAIDARHIYWTNNEPFASDSIGRANLDGTGIDQNFIPLPNALYNGVAVNATHIFWADGFRIGRANLNGTSPNTNFVTPPGGMLVARPLANATHLYATALVPNGDSTYGPAGHVLRGPVGGGAMSSIIPVSSPGGLAFYGGSLYFGRFNNTIKLPNDIGRAGLDGSAPQFGLVPQANFPNGIAVDAGGAAVVGKLKCNRKGCLLRIHVPMAGRVALKGKGIKPKARTVRAAADIKLKVVPRGGLRRKLSERGKAKVKIKVTLTASGFAPSTTAATVTLRD